MSAHSRGSALRLIGNVEIYDAGNAAIAFSYGAKWFQDSNEASKVIGSNNAIGIRIVSCPDIELNRNVRPAKSLTGKEITIDGVEYTYAQLESTGILEHPKFGSSLTDGKSNVGRGGQTFRGLASFSAETSKSVSLPVAFPDLNYVIKLAPSVDTTNLHYANKAVGGFDIVVDANITGEVSWEATKL